VRPCCINWYVIIRICCCREVFLFDRRYAAKSLLVKQHLYSRLYIWNYWRTVIVPNMLTKNYHRSSGCSHSVTLEWCYTVCMDTNCLVTPTLFAHGTVTRQSLHVRQWCSCLDIYGTMVVISNIPSLLDKVIGQECWTRLLDKFVAIHLQPATLHTSLMLPYG